MPLAAAQRYALVASLEGDWTCQKQCENSAGRTQLHKHRFAAGPLFAPPAAAQRYALVASLAVAAGAKALVDLGCGDGKFIQVSLSKFCKYQLYITKNSVVALPIMSRRRLDLYCCDNKLRQPGQRGAAAVCPIGKIPHELSSSRCRIVIVACDPVNASTRSVLTPYAHRATPMLCAYADGYLLPVLACFWP